MKKLTKKKLLEIYPGFKGFDWWCKHCEGLSTIDQIGRLMDNDCPDSTWANRLIVGVMKRKQRLKLAVFASEQVIDLYEKKYPDNEAPKAAINAAQAVIKRDSSKNRAPAYAAAYAAIRAARAARAANAAFFAAAANAADASCFAAAAAAFAAAFAAFAAYTTIIADTADAAAWAAAWAADAAAAAAGIDARKEMRIKILNYGLSLLKGGK